MLQPTPSPWSRRARVQAPVRQVSSEGPPHGDYASYVEQLLRSSPLYHSAAHRMAQGLASGDAGPAELVPGGQGATPWQQLRDRVQAALEQAQATAQQRTSGKGVTPAPSKLPAQMLDVPQAQRPWWKPTPFKVLMLLVVAALSPLLPAIGPLLLLVTLGAALRRGWTKAWIQAQRD